jgi:hypothetical protein
LGVSMTSDLFGESKYLQKCVVLEESEVCWGRRKNRSVQFLPSSRCRHRLGARPFGTSFVVLSGITSLSRRYAIFYIIVAGFDSC